MQIIFNTHLVLHVKTENLLKQWLFCQYVLRRSKKNIQIYYYCYNVLTNHGANESNGIAHTKYYMGLKTRKLYIQILPYISSLYIQTHWYTLYYTNTPFKIVNQLLNVRYWTDTMCIGLQIRVWNSHCSNVKNALYVTASHTRNNISYRRMYMFIVYPYFNYCALLSIIRNLTVYCLKFYILTNNQQHFSGI